MDRGLKMPCPLWELADCRSFPKHLVLTNISVCFCIYMFYMEKRSKLIDTLQVLILFTFFVVLCLQDAHQQFLPFLTVYAFPPWAVEACCSTDGTWASTWLLWLVGCSRSAATWTPSLGQKTLYSLSWNACSGRSQLPCKTLTALKLPGCGENQTMWKREMLSQPPVVPSIPNHRWGEESVLDTHLNQFFRQLQPLLQTEEKVQTKTTQLSPINSWNYKR